MRLLAPQKKEDWGKVKLKEEIDKIIRERKADTTQQTQKFSFQRELKEKVGLLEKVTKNFENKSTEVEEGLSSLSKKVRESLEKVEGFSGIVESKFRISKQELKDTAKDLQDISAEAQVHIDRLSETRAGMEGSLENIERRINDLADHDAILREGTKEYQKQRSELNREIISVVSEHKKFQATQRQLEEFFKNENARLQELLEVLNKDKVEVVSAQGEFKTLEAKLVQWSASLEKREVELFPKAEQRIQELRGVASSLEGNVDKLVVKYKGLEGLESKFAEASDVFQKEKAEAERVKEGAVGSIYEAQEIWETVLEDIEKKQKGLKEAQNAVRTDQVEVKKSVEALQGAVSSFNEWRIEADKTRQELNETRQKGKDELLDISRSCGQTFDALSKKLVELEEQNVLREETSEKFEESKNTAKGYILLAQKEKQELAEVREKDRLYFDKRKQEIAEAERLLIQDKFQIQSSKEYFEKIEKKLSDWEKRLESREQSLSAAFKEAVNKGIC